MYYPDRDKSLAYHDFIGMTEISCTYLRTTNDEKQTVMDILHDAYTDARAVSGTYKQRRRTLNSIYNAFLRGIGYNGYHWRDDGNNMEE